MLLFLHREVKCLALPGVAAQRVKEVPMRGGAQKAGQADSPVGRGRVVVAAAGGQLALCLTPLPTKLLLTQATPTSELCLLLSKLAAVSVPTMPRPLRPATGWASPLHQWGCSLHSACQRQGWLGGCQVEPRAC